MPITPCLAEPLFFFFYFKPRGAGEKAQSVNRLLGKYGPEFDLHHLQKRNKPTNKQQTG